MYRRIGVVGLFLVCSSATFLFFVDGARPSYAQNSNTVRLTLSISAPASGFSLRAEKEMIRGANAFDAVRQIVSLRYATHPQFGPFITGLAGVSPPAGWRLYVDGVSSDLGIAGIELEGDTVLEFRTQ